MTITPVRALAVAAVLAMAVVGCGSGTDETSTTTTTTTTTTTRPAPSTTTAPEVQPSTAIWPSASSSTRYDDPQRAATAFAVDYLGFTDPVVGAFQQGDSRSGEVPVRGAESGPVTTVMVRQLTADDTWWVLGAATDNLQLESPSWNASIVSPVTLSGQSTAFEATVEVSIRQDGATAPLATDIVMGGANGEMAPFSKAVTFAAPTEAAGAIVLETTSAENGHVLEATAVRVRFG